MKIRISVSEEKRRDVTDFMHAHGIETGEDADFILTESDRFPAFLSVRNDKKEHVELSISKVCYIEAYGKDIEIHTDEGVFLSQERMYQLEELLDPQSFLRISKSVIVAKRHIRKIRPSLSMKFILTLSDGTIVDVTRSYYSDFKRSFNI